MDAELLRKRLARTERKIALLEELIEQKTRENFLANEELRHAMERIELIHSAMPSALITIDAEGSVEGANESAAELLGYARDELVGLPASSVVGSLPGPDETDALLETETEWIARGSRTIPVLQSVSHLIADDHSLVVCVGVDLRERHRLESDLRRAQKLESVGQLAAGIAHEINTPIQFVSDNVQFISESLDDLLGLVGKYSEMVEGAREVLAPHAAAIAEIADEEEAIDLEFIAERGPKSCERAHEGLSRISEIVQAMRTFSHPEAKERTPIDLNESLQTALVVARNEYKYVAEVETEFAEMPSVLGHPGDLGQVFLNLLVNAGHAIEEALGADGGKGVIRIRTRLEPDWAVVEVQDSGTGIPEEIQHRVLDPFFTTKPVGKGTGQGLAITHAIVVERHSGRLDFETEAGVGTTFIVRLPLQTTAGDAEPAPAEPETVAT